MINKLQYKLYSFLRKSQKYTKTDNIYLIKHGSWLTMTQIISSVCSFLLALAFANLLPRETYGIYKYVLSIASLLAIPTLSGIDTAIVQAVSRGLEGSLIKGLKTKIKWGILGSLSSLCLSGYYFLNNNSTLTISFLIIAIFIPLMESFNLYGAFLSGRKAFDTYSKYVTSIRFASVIILISTLFLTKNLFLIIFAYFASYTFFRFFFLIITIKKFKPNKKEDGKTITYGKHLTLMRVISTIANYIDKILVFHFLGAVELAVYSFATVPPDQIKAVLKSIETLALPKFSTRNRKEIKKTIYSKMLIMALFITIAIAIYIPLAPFLYNIFFPQYTESIFFSQIFSISLIASIATLPHTALQAKAAKKQLYQFNIIAPIIRMSLLFFFIYSYGLLGIIIARVIGRFTNLAILYWLVKKM